jgi:hypothetical protein
MSKSVPAAPFPATIMGFPITVANARGAGRPLGPKRSVPSPGPCPFNKLCHFRVRERNE